ncbi:MAG: S8 family serine peptidase, partial [Planctomycetota bacterium]|nr:S8 family serine peptidase [Planctomycetota bacterium]
MQTHLAKQVEQIIDEGKGATRSVIVQMKTDGRETRALLETASQAVRHRSMLSTPREVLPPAISVLKAPRTGKRGAAKRRELREAEQSMVSQVASRAVKSITQKVLRDAGLGFLEPLISSDLVMEAISRSSRGARKKRKSLKRSVPQFWSSASAVLELSKDHLHKLPREVSKIADIFPNRTLKVPPVVEITSLPKNVDDNKTSAWGVHAIGALSAWGAYGSRGKGVKVAVLDTGVDAKHPDLRGKLSDWAEFDRLGRMVSGSRPHDSDQHGTHCAGTIAGGRESGQWIGVAPEAKIAGGLVLKRGSGTDAQILAGLQWALEVGSDVISMSLGGLRFGPDVLDTYSNTFISANRLGVPVVVSIGNEGSQTSGSPGNDYFALAVGATDHKDRAAGFSGGRTQVIRESRFIKPDFLPLVYSKPDL